MFDASLKAQAQALRKKGLAWAKIALEIGVHERTVYKWVQRGEVADPAKPPPDDGPPMAPAEIVASLWASLSRAARALEASDTPGGQSTTRTLKTVGDALDRLVALKATMAAADEKATAEEMDLDAFRLDLAKRIEALRAGVSIEQQIAEARERLAQLEAEAASPAPDPAPHPAR